MLATWRSAVRGLQDEAIGDFAIALAGSEQSKHVDLARRQAVGERDSRPADCAELVVQRNQRFKPKSARSNALVNRLRIRERRACGCGLATVRAFLCPEGQGLRLVPEQTIAAKYRQRLLEP